MYVQDDIRCWARVRPGPQWLFAGRSDEELSACSKPTILTSAESLKSLAYEELYVTFGTFLRPFENLVIDGTGPDDLFYEDYFNMYYPAGARELSRQGQKWVVFVYSRWSLARKGEDSAVKMRRGEKGCGGR